MTPLDTQVIKPKPARMAPYLLGALAFVAVGLWLVSVANDIVTLVVGLLSIAFFGGGLVLLCVQMVRQGSWKLTLTPAGVELSSGGVIPWDDVEAVGVAKDPTTMVWLRLRSYDRYLASVSPQRAREAGWTRRFMKPFAVLLSWVPGLRRYAKDVRDLDSELRWTREQFGYDLAYSPAWLDRPAEEFAELLERYRRAGGG